MARNHIAGIDLIRLFAAVAVMVFHLSWGNPLLGNVAPWGWVGVEIFFVISGLVIGQSALHSTPSRFLQSRFFRLVPTAVICALIARIGLLMIPAQAYAERGIWVFPEINAFVGSLLLVYPVHSASAYWTLPIEISFYAAIFAFLLARKMAYLDRFFHMMVLVSAAYMHVLLFSLFKAPSLEWLDFGFGLKNMLLVRHMPFFMLGYFIYRFCVLGEQPSAKSSAFLVFCLYLCTLEIGIRSFQLVPAYHFVTGFGPLAAMAIAVFLLAVYFLFKAATGQWRVTSDGQAGQMIRFAGLITYPVYLLHEVIGGAVLYLAELAGLPDTVGLVLAIPVVGLLAIGVVHAERWLDIRSWIHQKVPRLA